MDAGKLRSANTQIAALHLKTLLEAEWIEHFMCQTLEEPSHKEIAASVPVRCSWPFMGHKSRRPNQVSFEILIDGNFDEKSLFLAAIDTATLRATAL